ncbi:MAG: NAD(P)/FAD-dependent oxidoreductase [Elusimicrobia bacterium]|nr:NAD(P)/FAD-dependent oxidoreductase [Elusimicrobiota bacterium]
MPPTSVSPDAVDAVIVGAGPAGLTAGYLLQKAGRTVLILESDPTYVGGISRTVSYKGYRIDVGGHRFFSKSVEVNRLWDELLPDGFIERDRLSRIYYGGQYYSYPLKPGEALRKLGAREIARCLASYLKARAFPRAAPATFEDWVVNQFGERLYRIFFKTYTEKVWGMDCRSISADWAAQRIKTFSLGKAVAHALLPSLGPASPITTLLRSFKYPRRGPGMLWEECARRIVAGGGSIRMGCRATRFEYSKQAPRWLVEYRDGGGAIRHARGRHLVSSLALKDLVRHASPAMPPAAAAAADRLEYRNFFAAALVVPGPALFDDQWIYVHEPGVKAGRVQNYRSWSPDMAPGPEATCYGLEYFCSATDELWRMSDADALDLARREFKAIFGKDVSAADGCVVRQPRAYPVYSLDYQTSLAAIRSALDENFTHLHLVGRNGMHRYNNQDHSMVTAMFAAANILADRQLFDPWGVNSDAQYHESGHGGRLAPIAVAT